MQAQCSTKAQFLCIRVTRTQNLDIPMKKRAHGRSKKKKKRKEEKPTSKAKKGKTQQKRETPIETNWMTSYQQKNEKIVWPVEIKIGLQYKRFARIRKVYKIKFFPIYSCQIIGAKYFN